MDISLDFLEWLGPDTSTSVLMLLDDPADLLRVSAVSRSWRRFVILNGLCKKLCLRMCLEISYFENVIEISNRRDSSEVGSSTAMELENLEKEHMAYSCLSYLLASPTGNGECIAESIRASSTDNYPHESIEHTLFEDDRVDEHPSYWSSEGASDPGVPETLTYRLASKLCIINEIKIQPFEAYFQYGTPIYSAKAVRFRMGHSRSPQETGTDGSHSSAAQGTANEDYVWRYVSPFYPMVQENCLQSFKLPRPVMCLGGILQIELSGRVQVQEMDGLYYICVCHVQVIGCPLTPIFDVNIHEDSGRAVLNFFPEKRECDNRDSSVIHNFRENHHLRARRGWSHRFMNSLLGVMESDSDDEEDI